MTRTAASSSQCLKQAFDAIIMAIGWVQVWWGARFASSLQLMLRVNAAPQRPIWEVVGSSLQGPGLVDGAGTPLSLSPSHTSFFNPRFLRSRKSVSARQRSLAAAEKPCRPSGFEPGPSPALGFLASFTSGGFLGSSPSSPLPSFPLSLSLSLCLPVGGRPGDKGKQKDKEGKDGPGVKHQMNSD
jgi:hypothetical protein